MQYISGVQGPLISPYTIEVTRLDQGVATLKFFFNGVEKFTSTRAGWDDAIPWESGVYFAEQSTRFNTPMWDFINDPPNREGVQLHLAQSQTSPNPISAGSFGCIVADSAFLTSVANFIATNGTAPIRFDVLNDFPVSLSCSTSVTQVSEGSRIAIDVHLDANGNGISKDIYVKVDLAPGSTATAADFKFVVDPVPGTSIDDLRSLNGVPNAAKSALQFSSGFYVKIPAGQQTGQVVVDILQDNLAEQAEQLNFKIVDYAINSPYSDGTERLYSDYKSNPKLLIDTNNNLASITIGEGRTLDDESIVATGHNYTFVRNAKVIPGHTYSFSFDAYSIPDSIKIFDSKRTYLDTGLASGQTSGTFTIPADSDGFVTVRVQGNPDPSTQWDVFVGRSAGAQNLIATAAHGGAELGGSIAVTPAAAAQAVGAGADVLFQLAQAAAADFSANLVAGKLYSLTVIALDGSEVTPHVVVTNGIAAETFTLDLTFTGANASGFIRADRSESINIDVTDADGDSGQLRLVFREVSSPDLNAFSVGIANRAVQETSKPDADGISFTIYRQGDLSQGASVSWRLVPDGSAGVSAADFGGTLPTGTVNFAPGRVQQFIQILPLADGISEVPEGFRIELFNASGARIADLATHGQTGSANGILLDSFDAPVFDSGTGFADEIVGGAAGDNLSAGAGNDSIDGRGGNDFLYGGIGDDDLHGGLGDDIIRGGAGADRIEGGGGVDYADYTGEAGPIWINLGAGTGRWGTAEGDVLVQIYGVFGTDFADRMDGSGIADRLIGGNGDDLLFGRGGDDVIHGGRGADAIEGGAGTDWADYRGDVGAVWVDLATGIGRLNYAEGDILFDVENLLGTDFDDRLTGDANANALFGEGGNDTLDGGPGNDSLNGGAGTDTVSYASILAGGVTVTLASVGQQNTINGGLDTIGDDVENLLGSGFADTLTGDELANRLDGGGGADALAGGGGNDVYIVDVGGDTITEGVNAGVDEVRTALASYSLAAIANVENLTFTGNGSFSGTGNGLANAITGGDAIDQLSGLGGNDVLNGGAGIDTAIGGADNDTYYVDNAADQAIEAVGGGSDTVITNVSYSLAAGQEIEALTTYGSASTAVINLTGNAFGNLLVGNAAANILDGSGGADRMYGYAGNDTYYVDNAGDQVIEGAGRGSDTVFTNVSYTLGAGQEIETLTTYGSQSTVIDLTGNAFNNLLAGNAAANVLDGGGGIDRMYGYSGNDTYHVDNAGDQVIEGAGRGSDTVIASVSYALAAGQEVETLSTQGSLTTAVISLTGNEFANLLAGNAAANVLNGGAGSDRMYGYSGNDTYYVDNVGDQVIEGAGRGSDTVITNVSYALAAGQEIESLTTYGSSTTAVINLTGNEFGQTIVGNAAANVIDGKGGADTLYGYGGADIFAFTTALGGGNIDTIANFVAGQDKIRLENAIFTGLAAGALAPGAFHAGSAAADADDRIIYNSATGALLFDADGAGGAAAVQFATLAAGLPVTANEFTVI